MPSLTFPGGDDKAYSSWLKIIDSSYPTYVGKKGAAMHAQASAHSRQCAFAPVLPWPCNTACLDALRPQLPRSRLMVAAFLLDGGQ